MSSPTAVQRTLSHYLDALNGRAAIPPDFAAVDRIQIVACGTAYLRGQIGRYADRAAGGPARRCRDRLGVPLSQSGPAPGTLAIAMSASRARPPTPWRALRWCKAKGLKSAALVNVQVIHGPRGRHGLADPCGPEIGVASTKAFTAQVAALLALAVAAGGSAAISTPCARSALVKALLEAPRLIAEAMSWRTTSRRSPMRSPRRATCCSSAAAPCSRSPGRRAEAEGDQLHPRRRVCRRRVEARPDRLGRRTTPIIILAPL
jgi:glucosamine--fructose-6-phosphate aminotransferase (isomerizing)